MFQFLIGRLRTLEDGTVVLTLKEFQFLIGRLRTTQRIGIERRKYRVSIPHR